MPRPDLAAVGVKYRRTSAVSVSRDLYCDSALILQKLERLWADAEQVPVETAPSATA